jgi:hypothetical protein
LIEEVKDIAEAQQWPYFVYDTEFPADSFNTDEYDQETLYGISFSPPGCEPVWLCFLSNGRLSNPLNLKLYSNTTHPDEQRYIYMLSVKTQYAGIGIHSFVIQLLKYISTKFLEDFTLQDEGQYWETDDMDVLQQMFKRYNAAISTFKSSLEMYPKLPGETIGEYFERLLNNIDAERNNRV